VVVATLVPFWVGINSVNERWLEILLTPRRDEISVSEVCRRYGISRETFYQYRRRLWTEGVPALQPRSRRPRGCQIVCVRGAVMS
jgi:predicted DNA-binding transcriptional regulator YafY